MQRADIALATGAMEGQTPDQAFARIEAALARIEAAASRPRPADDGLAARHAALRSAVADSLSALDGLIADGTP